MKWKSSDVARVALAIAVVVSAYLLGKRSSQLQTGLFRAPFHSAESEGFETLSVQEITSNRWFRLEQHRVRMQTGDGEKVVNDWIWWSEPDHVNVLVHEAASDSFLVFRQSKYGIAGSTLATVGGHIEEGETPLAAAKRELLEEMGMEAADKDWSNLGSYRVSANRGGGMVSCFFAWNARPAANARPSDEVESQKTVKLSRRELQRKLLAGEFKEIKWSATVAMSLLLLDAKHANDSS